MHQSKAYVALILHQKNSIKIHKCGGFFLIFLFQKLEGFLCKNII